jgi:uncharacterized membrane protein
MWSIVISTIVFFVASFFLKRHLEGMGIEKSMTRGVVVFTGAMVLSYAAAAAVDWLAAHV